MFDKKSAQPLFQTVYNPLSASSFCNDTMENYSTQHVSSFVKKDGSKKTGQFSSHCFFFFAKFSLCAHVWTPLPLRIFLAFVAWPFSLISPRSCSLMSLSLNVCAPREREREREATVAHVSLTFSSCTLRGSRFPANVILFHTVLSSFGLALVLCIQQVYCSLSSIVCSVLVASWDAFESLKPAGSTCSSVVPFDITVVSEKH
jgi:hypothetical protein